jgi:hypothetical protein
MATDIQLEDIDTGKGFIRQRTHLAPVSSHHATGNSADLDRSQLARAGKRQVLEV